MSDFLYKNKYIKYKTKYLKLKYNEQQGGLLDDYYLIGSKKDLTYLSDNKIFSEKDILLSKDGKIYKVNVKGKEIKLLTKDKYYRIIKYFNSINSIENYRPVKIILEKNININDITKKIRDFVNRDIDSYMKVKNYLLKKNELDGNIVTLKPDLLQKPQESLYISNNISDNSDKSVVLSNNFDENEFSVLSKSANNHIEQDNDYIPPLIKNKSCIEDYIDNELERKANNDIMCDDVCSKQLTEEAIKICKI